MIDVAQFMTVNDVVDCKTLSYLSYYITYQKVLIFTDNKLTIRPRMSGIPLPLIYQSYCTIFHGARFRRSSGPVTKGHWSFSNKVIVARPPSNHCGRKRDGELTQVQLPNKHV